MRDHLLENYDYNLPQELIATHPASPRESARLLIYDRKKDSIIHSDFFHFFDFISHDTLFVLNDTKVIKARLFGQKIHPQNKTPQSEKKFEIFYHHPLHRSHNQPSTRFLVQIRGKVTEGTCIALSPSFYLRVCACFDSGLREVEFYLKDQIASLPEVLAHLDLLGHTPLPPYIKRSDEDFDQVEYQSVFASKLGAVAAPTASLHFSDIDYLKAHYDHCFLTLHVGAGTFLSVETPDIRDHKIHSEAFEISKQSWQKILNAQNILCVGTTSARVVEYLAQNPSSTQAHLSDPIVGECDIFLHPFNPPQKINSLLTNFHLPRSTLIMLVSSLLGREKCLEIYQEAIQRGYRFYSYGDGMLIL